ncbi:hypothetical protein Tco_0853812 [Tanacetum coccineum]
MAPVPVGSSEMEPLPDFDHFDQHLHCHLEPRSGSTTGTLVTDIYEKDKNDAKTDKTEHGMEKSVRSQKVNPDKVKVKGGAEK